MINFPQSIVEAHEHLIAGWDVCPDERTNYFICEALMLLLSEKDVKEHCINKYGIDTFNEMNDNIKQYFKLLSITKFYLDSLSNTNLNKDVIKDSKYYDMCVQVATKIPIIQEQVFQLWYEIVKNSNLINSYPKKHQLRPYEQKFKMQLLNKANVDKSDPRFRFDKNKRSDDK